MNNAPVRKPPAPAGLFRLLNPVMKLLLNSPMHRLISSNLMLLTFTGRKSGRRYSTPVGYLRRGNLVYVMTQSPWWVNLRGGAAVTVRLQGISYQGMARVVDDPETIKTMVRELMAVRGEAMARRLGYWTEDVNAPAQKVAQDVQGTIFIQVELAQVT